MKQTFVDKSVSKSKKGLVTLEPSIFTCGQKRRYLTKNLRIHSLIHRWKTFIICIMIIKILKMCVVKLIRLQHKVAQGTIYVRKSNKVI